MHIKSKSTKLVNLLIKTIIQNSLYKNQFTYSINVYSKYPKIFYTFSIYIYIYLKKCFLIEKSQSSQCECRD